MYDCTRRTFMKSGALALFALGGAPRFLIRAARAQERGGRPKILVALFQRGAVDGLSMIVPHGDPAYYASRGSIAVARPTPGHAETTVDLDGFFGLHPAMSPLKPIWDDRRLAIVHACGSPDTTRSHFDAQDYMESGTPGLKSTADAVRIRQSGGQLHVTDGPFTEAKEVVGGYALVEVKSKEEARKVARQFMEIHLEHWPAFEGECEVRPLEDM